MIKDRLKELRESNNMSLTEFAKAVGIAKSSVSIYESGKQKPGRKAIDKICKTFGVDKEWLLGEDESVTDAEKDMAIQAKSEPIIEPEEVSEVKEPEVVEEPKIEPEEESVVKIESKTANKN